MPRLEALAQRYTSGCGVDQAVQPECDQSDRRRGHARRNGHAELGRVPCQAGC
jgi:hypothetical protein